MLKDLPRFVTHDRVVVAPPRLNQHFMFANNHSHALATVVAQLPALLRQLVADLNDPSVAYLLGGHFYDRTAHPRRRHFPAVFALRQGGVWNIEIGPDFLAFDTEFTHFPDRGEPHYPGPWTDRFRATVPFAQLYQLCRKVLTAAEQTAESVNYEPETIIYYNAAIHRNYPTPADINQAYAAAPTTDEHPLVAALTAVAAGLVDPANHYVVNTTHFDSPYGPVLMGMLHLHAHSVGDFQLESDAFTCLVRLNSHDPQEKVLVRVGFAQVWLVVRSDSPQMELDDAEETGDILYDAPHVLQAYAQQGRPA